MEYIGKYYCDLLNLGGYSLIFFGTNLCLFHKFLSYIFFKEDELKSAVAEKGGGSSAYVLWGVVRVFFS